MIIGVVEVFEIDIYIIEYPIIQLFDVIDKLIEQNGHELHEVIVSEQIGIG